MSGTRDRYFIMKGTSFPPLVQRPLEPAATPPPPPLQFSDFYSTEFHFCVYRENPTVKGLLAAGVQFQALVLVPKETRHQPRPAGRVEGFCWAKTKRNVTTRGHKPSPSPRLSRNPFRTF